MPWYASLMRETGQFGITADTWTRINLDGGGSSTLVVNGSLVNRPVGVALEREVMSAIATFCGEPEEMS